MGVHEKWRLLLGPGRRWLQACRALAANPTALEFVAKWPSPEWVAVLRADTLGRFLNEQMGAVWIPTTESSADSRRLRVLELHLDVIRASIDPDRRFADPARPLAEDVAARLADNHGLDPGGVAVVHDLHHEIFSPIGGPRAAKASASMRILQGLSAAHGQIAEGQIFRFTAELVPGGAGRVYPATEMLPTFRDDGWKAAEQAAEEFVRKRGAWPADADIRWRVTGPWDKPIDLDTALCESSAGAAMGLALAHLLGIPGFAEVELERLAISAVLRPDGPLSGVGELDSKIMGILLARSLPAIVRLGVAQSQKGIQGNLELRSVTNTTQGSILCDPGRPELHILTAPGLDDIAKLCLLDRQRYPQADAHTRRRTGRTTGIVPLEYVQKKVEATISELSSGFIEIVGQAGVGKSTLMEELIRAQREQNPMNEPIVFFAEADGVDSPEDVVREFYQQVRRKYGIEDVATNNAVSDLRTVLGKVSDLLAAPDRPAGFPDKEILFIDAADQLKASGPLYLLPDWVRSLPDRVVMVVTSRSDRRWQDPARPQISRTLYFPDPEDEAAICEYRSAVEAWLTNRVDELGLSREFARQVAYDGDGALPVFKAVSDLASVRKADRTRTDLEDPEVWRRASDEIVMDKIIDPALLRLQARGIGDKRLWEALGLVAASRGEGLSPAQWEALGLWDDTTKHVLTEVASLFEPRPKPRHESKTPYRLAHPDNMRIVRQFLCGTTAPVAWDSLHRRLGAACMVAWRSPDNPARWYALRHAVAHLLEAGQADAVAEVLIEIPFLAARLGVDSARRSAPEAPMTVHEVLGDYAGLPPGEQSDSMGLQGRALGEALDRQSHYLTRNFRSSPEVLIQCLFNELAAHFDEATPLGHQLRDAAGSLTQPWIERRGPSPHETPQRRRILEQAAAVTALTSHRTQPLIAAGCADGTIHLWHADTGAPATPTLGGHQGPVLALDFDPDQPRSLVSAGEDGSVRIWRWSSKQEPSFRTLFAAGDWIRAVAFRPCHPMLACGGNRGFVHIVDTRHGRLLWEYRAHASWLTALAFSPDGRLLVSSGYDGKLRLWRLSAEHVHEELVRTASDIVYVLAFNPKVPTMLATADVKGRILLWDLERKPWAPVELPGRKARPTSISFHTSGRLLSVGFAGGNLLIWDAEQCRPICEGFHSFAGGVRGAAFIADRKLMAVASGDAVSIWDVGRMEQGQRSRAPAKERHVTAGVFNSKGSMLALGEADGTISVVPVRADAATETVLRGHDREVWCVAFAPGDSLLATGGRDTKVRLWDLQTSGLQAEPLHGHEDWVTSLSFSPNGRWLASGGREGSVRLWNAADGKPARRALWLHKGSVRALAFSPDSELLATAGDDGKVNVVGIPGHTKLITFTGVPSAALTSITFDSRGLRLIAGDATGALHLWSLDASVPAERIAPPARYPVTHLAELGGTSLVAVATANGQLNIRAMADGNRAGTVALYACDNRVIALWAGGRYAEDMLVAEAPPNAAPQINFLRLHNVKRLSHDRIST